MGVVRVVGSGKALIRHLALVAFVAIASLGFVPTAAAQPGGSCSAYQGNSLPSINCSFQSSQSAVSARLSPADRERLGYDKTAVNDYYADIETHMLNCFRPHSDAIGACRLDSSAAERDRASRLASQLNDLYSREKGNREQARRSAIATAEAGERARRAQQQAGGGNPTANVSNPSATGDDDDDLPDGATLAEVDPTASSQDCLQVVSDAEDQGTAWNQARAATIFDRTLRNVSADAAIRAAMCIDDLMDKVNQVTRAFTAIINSVNHPLIAILTAIATEILLQIVEQFLDNVVNAVCNAANDLFNALDNRLRNALCVEASIDGINPFEFDIDIPAMQCNGWSIDLLSGRVLGQPIDGMNVNWGQVRDAASSAANAPMERYRAEQQDILNNSNLTQAQRDQQLRDLCRRYAADPGICG